MSRNRGVLAGLACYLLWGAFPLYFKALQHVPALQILFHRVVWSFWLLVAILLVRKEWPQFKAQAAHPRVVLIYGLAGALLSINWLTYIWGVNDGQVVETSLGYFINPLVSVALGVIFLREKLRPLQWLPIGLAAGGVLYLTLEYGRLPWIALILAFSFGAYGLIKKVASLGSLYSLTLETAILFIPSFLYLLWVENQGIGTFGHADLATHLLLGLSGVVTAVPLLLFASAARAIPLSLMGLLQYVAPTCQFLLGVLVFGEPFTADRIIGFSMIWTALLIFSLEGFAYRVRAFRTVAAD